MTAAAWPPTDAGSCASYAPFVVCHVETEAHEVLLAEGAPAESFIDHAGRAGFDTYADFQALHDQGHIISELRLPRETSARTLRPELRLRLDSVA